MQDFVTDITMSATLKRLFIEQDSQYYWCRSDKKLYHRNDLFTQMKDFHKHYISAFLDPELDRVLPASFDEGKLIYGKSMEGVCYVTYGEDKLPGVTTARTFIRAKARMVVKLKELNII